MEREVMVVSECLVTYTLYYAVRNTLVIPNFAIIDKIFLEFRAP
jgi:hypothetical protein